MSKICKIDQFEYIIPPSIEEEDEAKKIFMKLWKRSKVLQKITEILFKNILKNI